MLCYNIIIPGKDESLAPTHMFNTAIFFNCMSFVRSLKFSCCRWIMSITFVFPKLVCYDLVFSIKFLHIFHVGVF